MPWIIAHRGASDDEPENTLRAFRRAIELGADMVELDVHLSRDGHVVVIHEDPVTEAQGAGASYVHLCWERRSNNPAEFLTADLLTRIRSRGLRVILWHEERTHVIEALRGVDVDGVCSNRPELLLALKQSDGTNAWNR